MHKAVGIDLDQIGSVILYLMLTIAISFGLSLVIGVYGMPAYVRPGDAFGHTIFADGAAAVAGSAAPAGGWALKASGSCLIPESAPDMGWTVGDHGFVMTLSRKVPALIAAHLRDWLVGWLRDNGLSLDDVRHWAVHPGGPKILTAVEESLGLPPAALAPSRAVFAEYGNMSSPTVLFVLDRLRREGAAGPCVALGFGPGLVAEAALFA